MRIAVFSDLHLEFNKTVNLDASDADVIVLAGDIGKLQEALTLAERCVVEHRIPVIYVPGNHEYYGQDYDLLNEHLGNWQEPSGLVHVLLNRAITIAGVRFIGSTLWTDFQLRGLEASTVAAEAAQKYLPDFKLIRRGERAFSADDARELYEQAREFLAAELASSAGPQVVVTHFAPHADCCAEQFVSSPITPYFINDCSDLIEKYQPDLWLFGHTHHSVDFQLGRTRIFSNQHGYPHEVEKVSGFVMNQRVTLQR